MLKDITVTYHFKHFFDTLYSLDRSSPKNQNELKLHCISLNGILLKLVEYSVFVRLLAAISSLEDVSSFKQVL